MGEQRHPVPVRMHQICQQQWSKMWAPICADACYNVWQEGAFAEVFAGLHGFQRTGN